jgi:thiol-disulfide isomerase/thioredoxin
LVLRTADGRQFNLQEECGKRPVLLAFESPRCKPCRESRPALDKLCQDYGSGNKVALLSVMLGSEAASQTGGGTLPHAPHCSETLAAGSDATAEEFGVFGTPVFFLIGRQGTVLWKHVGRLALGAVDQALDTGLAALNPSAR